MALSISLLNEVVGETFISAATVRRKRVAERTSKGSLVVGVEGGRGDPEGVVVDLEEAEDTEPFGANADSILEAKEEVTAAAEMARPIDLFVIPVEVICFG